jgi:SAM-dependent methyltransferase
MSPRKKARYDGLAAWYDHFIGSSRETASALASVPKLLGRGPGTCLDIGCGTGVSFEVLKGLGWSIVGVDISADQLRVAADRARQLDARIERADAAQLPFGDGSFDAAVSILTHTDFDDPRAVFREAARVVRRGGHLAYVGVHPCYVGPMTERPSDAPPVLKPGYRRSGWWHMPDGPSVRNRAGVHHQTLADLLNAIVDAGWRIERVDEPDEADYPMLLGIRAQR